jgi:hypothetical protein
VARLALKDKPIAYLPPLRFKLGLEKKTICESDG